MISITCTNCKTLLTIDDAFAGGVCRCQHCGTIQTVPAAGSGGTQTAVKEPKTLYQNPARGGGGGAQTGTGLDDLANVVASSGLGSGIGSGLQRQAGLRTPPPQAKDNKTTLLLILAGVIIVLLVGVLLLVLLRGGSSQSPGPTAQETPATPSGSSTPAPDVPPPAPLEPMFCGVKLNGTSVVYVLDRGSGTQNFFSSLKEATFSSIESLGSDRKFEIVFWSNGTTETAYPDNSTTFATKENLEAARRSLEDVYAFGQTDVKPALIKAISRNPDIIILATGKGWDLDESFVQLVDDIRKTSRTKIYTFALGQAGTSTALRTIASKTGGEFREVSEGDLKNSIR